MPLSDELWDALYATKRINSVYAHQAQAINQLDKGKNVIVCTSTSSGKSLIYQVPAIKAFERDEEATALYVFPTKALAQDQKRALGELVAAHEGLSRIKVPLLPAVCLRFASLTSIRSRRSMATRRARTATTYARMLMSCVFCQSVGATTMLTTTARVSRSLRIRTCST